MVTNSGKKSPRKIIALVVPFSYDGFEGVPGMVAGRHPAEWPLEMLAQFDGIEQIFWVETPETPTRPNLEPYGANLIEAACGIELPAHPESHVSTLLNWVEESLPAIAGMSPGQSDENYDLLLVSAWAPLLDVSHIELLTCRQDYSSRITAAYFTQQFVEASQSPAYYITDFLEKSSTFDHVQAPFNAPDPFGLWQPRGREQWLAAEAILRDRQRGRRLNLLPEQPGAIVFDFDGVFTDNRVLVWEDGREGVLCNRGDGMGFDLLRERNFPVLVLSKERNPVVAARCKKLKLPCHQGEDDKITKLNEWLHEQGVPLERAIYVGNDVNDLECLRAVGCGVAPADAHPTAANVSQIILEANGGFGAVREIIDLLLQRLGA